MQVRYLQREVWWVMSFLTRYEQPQDVLQAVDQLIASRRSENTRKAYQSDWVIWQEFCVQRDVNLKTPTLPVTVAFRDELSGRYATKTVDRVLGTLNFFYKAFLSVGLVKINPFDAAWLPRPTVIVNHTAAVPAADAEVLLEYVENLARGDLLAMRDYAVLRLLYDTGLRRSSVCTAQRGNFVHVGNKNFLTVMVKGGTREEVAVPEKAGLAIVTWLKHGPQTKWIFPGRNREQPMNLAMINKIVTARAEEVGIPHIHPHSFRASFITTGFDAKIYEHDLQASVHHRSPEQTKSYDRGKRGFSVPDQIANFRKGQK